MVDAQNHQEESPGVHLLLPACQHLEDCLCYPCVYQAVLRLGTGREVPQHLQRGFSRHWLGCETCPRNLYLCPWEPLLVLGSCHSLCTTLRQPIEGCTGLGEEASPHVLMLPTWIFCHYVSCLVPFYHLLKASFVRKGVKTMQDNPPSHRSLNVCIPWTFATWLSKIDMKRYKWGLKQLTLTMPYLQKEWTTYRMEFWHGQMSFSFLIVLYALYSQHCIFQLSFVSWILSQVLLYSLCVTVSIFFLCPFSSILHKNTCSILKCLTLSFLCWTLKLFLSFLVLPHLFPPWDHLTAWKDCLWSLSVE